jgi:hypothetical protein
MRGARIRGRIDLMLHAEGGPPKEVELIDFKTAANQAPDKRHQNQLRLYAEAARTLGLNPVRLIIHNLDTENGGRIIVDENESEMAQFRDELYFSLEEIEAGRFPAKKSKDTCSIGDFDSLCESN